MSKSPNYPQGRWGNYLLAAHPGMSCDRDPIAGCPIQLSNLIHIGIETWQRLNDIKVGPMLNCIRINLFDLVQMIRGGLIPSGHPHVTVKFGSLQARARERRFEAGRLVWKRLLTNLLKPLFSHEAGMRKASLCDDLSPIPGRDHIRRLQAISGRVVERHLRRSQLMPVLITTPLANATEATS